MIVGITGGIGSGKSTVARALQEHGFAVYDCDREAKRIIAENEPVRAAITDLLGKEAFVNGQYNTTYVARRVFAEPQLRQALNDIVHPSVREDIRSRYLGTEGCFIIESAILFEAGLDHLCDKIIVVEAPENVRIERVICRDYNGVASPENISKIRARIASQNSVAPQSCNIITVNNDGLSPLSDIAADIISKLQIVNRKSSNRKS